MIVKNFLGVSLTHSKYGMCHGCERFLVRPCSNGFNAERIKGYKNDK